MTLAGNHLSVLFMLLCSSVSHPPEFSACRALRIVSWLRRVSFAALSTWPVSLCELLPLTTGCTEQSAPFCIVMEEQKERRHSFRCKVNPEQQQQGQETVSSSMLESRLEPIPKHAGNQGYNLFFTILPPFSMFKGFSPSMQGQVRDFCGNLDVSRDSQKDFFKTGVISIFSLF